MKQALTPTSTSGNGPLRKSIGKVLAARSTLNDVFSKIALFDESQRHITAAIRLVPPEKENTNLRQVSRYFRNGKADFEKEARRKALELHDALTMYMSDVIKLKIAPSFASIGVEVVAPPVGNNAVHATAVLRYDGVMPHWDVLWQASLTEEARGKLSPIRLYPERNLGTDLKQVEIPLAQFDTFRREANKMTVATLKTACENFAQEALSARNDLFEPTVSSKGREFRILSGNDEGRPISIEMRQAGYQLVPIVNIGLYQIKISTFKGALDYAISVGSEKSTGNNNLGHTNYNMDVGFD